LRLWDPMANKHFGNWADVFKHLALCEVLRLHQPHEYWESHAGAARYPLESGAERAHGIAYFLDHASESGVLQKSTYVQQLAQIHNGQALAFFPGSPWLAMKLLGENVRRYLFCDTDDESLRDIVNAAADLHVPPASAECVQDDGVTIVRGAGVMLPDRWTGGTMAFLDPYDALEERAGQIDTLGLFCELATRGIVVLMWYGFENEPQRKRLHEEFVKRLDRARLLGGNIGQYESALAQPPAGTAPPTLYGCGLLTANMSNDAGAAVEGCVRALTGVYRGAKLEGWGSGAVEFTKLR